MTRMLSFVIGYLVLCSACTSESTYDGLESGPQSSTLDEGFSDVRIPSATYCTFTQHVVESAYAAYALPAARRTTEQQSIVDVFDNLEITVEQLVLLRTHLSSCRVSALNPFIDFINNLPQAITPQVKQRIVSFVQHCSRVHGATLQLALAGIDTTKLVSDAAQTNYVRANYTRVYDRAYDRVLESSTASTQLIVSLPQFRTVVRSMLMRYEPIGRWLVTVAR